MKRFFSFILLCFMLLCSSCAKDDTYALSVVAPSGAPGIALAEVSYRHSDAYSVELNKTADVLKTAFISAEADVIVAPVNLGATLYKTNEAYQLAAVLTWGNLYFASRKADFTLEDLNGADIVLFGQGTVNDAVVQYVLKEKNIVLGENAVYLASTELTNQKLVSDAEAIVLVAEPALSAARSKIEGITALSVQDLYKEVSGSNSYPQAGCFIKTATATEHKSVIDGFLKTLEASCGLCNTDTATVAEYAVELGLGSSKAVLEQAIPNSNILYVSALSAKEDIEKMAELNLKLFGGEKPAEGFYYA